MFQKITTRDKKIDDDATLVPSQSSFNKRHVGWLNGPQESAPKLSSFHDHGLIFQANSSHAKLLHNHWNTKNSSHPKPQLQLLGPREQTYVDVCQAVHPLPSSFSKSSGTISCPFRRKVRTFTSSIERYFLWHPKTESTSISAGYPFATKQLDYLTFLPGPTPSSKCHWNLSCAILCIHTIHCGCNNTWTHHTPNPNPAACHEPRLLPQTKQASWKTHFFTGLCKTMAPYSSIRLCPLPSQQKCRQFWSPQCIAHHPTQTIALGVLLATNWSRYSGPSWPH